MPDFADEPATQRTFFHNKIMRHTIHQSASGRRFLSLLGLAIACAPANAQSHYPLGLEGLNGGTWAEPGFHLRDYNTFYYSDRLNDPSGDNTSVDLEFMNYANGIRPIWVSNFEVLGAHYGCDVLVPITWADVRSGSFHEDTAGLGDILVEPVSFSWHTPHFDALIAYGFWAPTGDTGAGPVTPGVGYWTHMFTGGGTWYPDRSHDWSISLLGRYEINTEDDLAQVTRGDTFALEWGIGRAFAPDWKVGVVGYYQRQLTGDSGVGLHSDALSTVAAVGPEISFAPRDRSFSISLRYEYEILAEDRSQGQFAALTLSKKF